MYQPTIMFFHRIVHHILGMRYKNHIRCSKCKFGHPIHLEVNSATEADSVIYEYYQQLTGME